MQKSSYKIQYFSFFENELDEIIYYISKVLKSQKAAEDLLEKVEKAIKERSKSPASYELYKSNKKRNFLWYRIYVKNFIIFYTIENDTMKVAHIIYSKRDFERYI